MSKLRSVEYLRGYRDGAKDIGAMWAQHLLELQATFRGASSEGYTLTSDIDETLNAGRKHLWETMKTVKKNSR